MTSVCARGTTELLGVRHEPVRDDRIGGYRVPAGLPIVLNQIAVYHDPEYVGDPKAFTTERWTDDFEASLPQFAFFSFGGGAPPACIDERITILEATLAVGATGQRYHFMIVSDGTLTLQSHFPPVRRTRSGFAPRPGNRGRGPIR